MPKIRFVHVLYTVILMILALIVWLVYQRYEEIPRQVERSRAEFFETSVQSVLRLIEWEIETGVVPLDHFEDQLRRVGRPLPLYISQSTGTRRDQSYLRVIDSQGHVVFDEDSKLIGTNLSGNRIVQKSLEGHCVQDVSMREGDTLTSVLCPLRVKGHVVALIGLGKSNHDIQPLIHESQRNLVMVGVAASLTVLMLGILAILFFLKPIELWLSYVKQLRRYQYPDHGPIRRRHYGRIGPLLDRVYEAVAGRQYIMSYVQHMTHEFKTPLTAIRHYAELIEAPIPKEDLDRFLNLIQHNIERMDDLIHRLLALADLEQLAQLGKTSVVDLRSLVKTAIEHVQGLALRSNIAIKVSYAGEMNVKGDPFYLDLALVNLLKNALEFSSAGDTIKVFFHQDKDRCTVVIEVQGPGIPAYAKDQVFDRFFTLERPDGLPKGSGIGLSLVREIVELHHGTITLQNGGQGALASLCLPMCS